jgi:hypothetical protein
MLIATIFFPTFSRHHGRGRPERQNKSKLQEKSTLSWTRRVTSTFLDRSTPSSTHAPIIQQRRQRGKSEGAFGGVVRSRVVRQILEATQHRPTPTSQHHRCSTSENTHYTSPDPVSPTQNNTGPTTTPMEIGRPTSSKPTTTPIDTGQPIVAPSSAGSPLVHGGADGDEDLTLRSEPDTVINQVRAQLAEKKRQSEEREPPPPVEPPTVDDNFPT